MLTSSEIVFSFYSVYVSSFLCIVFMCCFVIFVSHMFLQGYSYLKTETKLYSSGKKEWEKEIMYTHNYIQHKNSKKKGALISSLACTFLGHFAYQTLLSTDLIYFCTFISLSLSLSLCMCQTYALYKRG